MEQFSLSKMVDNIVSEYESDVPYMGNIVEDDEAILKEIDKLGWEDYEECNERLY